MGPLQEIGVPVVLCGPLARWDGVSERVPTLGGLGCGASCPAGRFLARPPHFCWVPGWFHCWTAACTILPSPGRCAALSAFGLLFAVPLPSPSRASRQFPLPGSCLCIPAFLPPRSSTPSTAGFLP